MEFDTTNEKCNKNNQKSNQRNNNETIEMMYYENSMDINKSVDITSRDAVLFMNDCKNEPLAHQIRKNNSTTYLMHSSEENVLEMNSQTTVNSSSISTSHTNLNYATENNLNVNKLQFKCRMCKKIFSSNTAYTSHLKVHFDEKGKNNMCKELDSPIKVGLQYETTCTNTTVFAKKNQSSSVSGSDPYECNICQKSFAVPARLVRHYRTHTGERPFECEFCHKLFSVKENLQVHRRIHTKERPYKCDICGRAFEHSGKLHRHMRIHTGERPHKCSVCQKTFIQSGQLVIHMRTHTGEKPYKCPVDGCGKGFTCSKQLKVHSRTHTGEKPYHCDICLRDFGYNHVLKLHRVQHYGSKCYKCTICDETFKNKKEMEAHIRAHSTRITDEDCKQSTKIMLSSLPNLSEENHSSRKSECNQSLFELEKEHNFDLNNDSSEIMMINNVSVESSNLTFNTQNCTSLEGLEKNVRINSTNTFVKNSFIEKKLLENQYYQDREVQNPFSELAIISSSHQNNQENPIVPVNIDSPIFEATSVANCQDSSEREKNVTESPLQILQMQRTRHNLQQHQLQPIYQSLQLLQRNKSDNRKPKDDVNKHNINLNHGYDILSLHNTNSTSLPLFTSSILNNDIMVRQVEAAIAPLRSSESSERSSSPDSDTVVNINRIDMNLPLRKRKLYLNEKHYQTAPIKLNNTERVENLNINNDKKKELSSTGVRMSSVIQFAKALN